LCFSQTRLVVNDYFFNITIIEQRENHLNLNFVGEAVSFMQKKRILVADDSVVIVEMLQFIFSQNSEADVVVAEDGVKALEFIQKEKFDLVICDIDMPKKSGILFGFEVRSLKVETPIIYFTSFNDTQINRAQRVLDDTTFYVGEKDVDKLLKLVKKILNIDLTK